MEVQIIRTVEDSRLNPMRELFGFGFINFSRLIFYFELSKCCEFLNISKL